MEYFHWQGARSHLQEPAGSMNSLMAAEAITEAATGYAKFVDFSDVQLMLRKCVDVLGC